MLKQVCTVKLQPVKPWPNNRLLVIPWLAKPDLLRMTFEHSSDQEPVLSLCSAAPQISPEGHSTQNRERLPLGLLQRAGRQPVSRGQMQSTPNGNHRQEKEGDGNPWGSQGRKRKTFSQELQRAFAWQREKPGSSIAAPQITTKMHHMVPTWSQPGAGCSTRLTGPSASLVGSGCFQGGWSLTGLLGTPPSHREPYLAATSCSPPAPEPARRKGSCWPLASTSCIALNIVFRLCVLFSMKQTYRRKWTGFCF